MKGTTLAKVLVLGLVLVVCQAGLSYAAPIGTGFTYQGRLIDANSAADGLYDFQFRLYNANVAGTQKGSTINTGEVDVIDGYFTVSLDFGSDVFDGNDRWLEIGVRVGELKDPNAYTILSPRQLLTTTPYAIYAKTAGSSVSADSDWIVSGNNMYSGVSGNVGIGTASPGYKLTCFDNNPSLTAGNHLYAEFGPYTTTNGNYDRGVLYFGYTSDGTVGQGAYIRTSNNLPLALMPEGGNVGIGTASPQYKLDVEGDVQAYAYHTGDIFIGTVSPGYKLNCFDNNPSLTAGNHVYAEFGPYTTTNGNYDRGALCFGYTSDGTVGQGAYIRTSNDLPLALMPEGGNVGIGTTDPGTYKLYVAGSAYSTGGWQSSDLRFKKNIETINSPLEKIMNIKGVSFEWKTTEYKDKGLPEGRHYGVIAQDVEQVLPQIVKEGPDGEKAVSYTELIPILTEAIKQQQKQIESLRSQVQALQEAIQHHQFTNAKEAQQ